MLSIAAKYLVTAIKGGNAVISKIGLCNPIEEIYQTIYNVYSDISGYHYRSAVQCIKSTQDSQNYEAKILDAISHVRDAYNVTNILINKTKKIKFLGFTIADDEWVIDDEWKRVEIYLSIADMSGLIAFLYNQINDTRNFEEWKNTAVKEYRFALGYHYEIRPQETAAGHPEYLREEWVDGGYIGEGVMGKTKEYRFSEKGHEYVDNLVQKEIDAIVEAISTKKEPA